jgi:hypothetical protein
VVDREAAAEVLRAAPDVRAIARENRAFLQRVVRFLVGEAGIRQIIDIGTGIPAAGNVHRCTPPWHLLAPVLLPALPAIAEFTCVLNGLLWPAELVTRPWRT